MSKEEFQNLLNNLNIVCNEKEYDALLSYASFLKEYNEHTNLTAITNDKEIFVKHFYDSLTLRKIIDFNNINNMLDIGTGAGFPGVVIKIFFPHIHVTLLDSNNKKTKFLNELVHKLELQDIEIVTARAEDYIKVKINYYDLVTARAVANLRVLSELSLPFVKENGYFVALKGNADKEVEEAINTINKMDAFIENQKIITLPDGQGTRTLISIKKTTESKLSQLRPYNKILKSELK